MNPWTLGAAHLLRRGGRRSSALAYTRSFIVTVAVREGFTASLIGVPK
jgi:hypothetical protein